MAEFAEQTASVETRLTDALLAAGKLDAANAERARRACAKSNDRIDRVLVQLGLVSESDMAAAFAAMLDLPVVASDA
jgi:general secretion pathway protein E